MDDRKIQDIMKDMVNEAEEIMNTVNADPMLKDIKAPEELHKRIFEEIRKRENGT